MPRPRISLDRIDLHLHEMLLSFSQTTENCLRVDCVYVYANKSCLFTIVIMPGVQRENASKKSRICILPSTTGKKNWMSGIKEREATEDVKEVNAERCGVPGCTVHAVLHEFFTALASYASCMYTPAQDVVLLVIITRSGSGACFSIYRQLICGFYMHERNSSSLSSLHQYSRT